MVVMLSPYKPYALSCLRCGGGGACLIRRHNHGFSCHGTGFVGRLKTDTKVMPYRFLGRHGCGSAVPGERLTRLFGAINGRISTAAVLQQNDILSQYIHSLNIHHVHSRFKQTAISQQPHVNMTVRI